MYAASMVTCVWDVTIEGACFVGCLVGHSTPISFVTFSSIILEAEDQSVRIWQSSALDSVELEQCPTDCVKWILVTNGNW